MASWSPFKPGRNQIEQEVNSQNVCAMIAESVSNADWSYCMPIPFFPSSINEVDLLLDKPAYEVNYTGASTLACLLVPQGQGRNNFTGAWNSPNFELDYNMDPHSDSANDNVSLWLPVPYPEIPPDDLFNTLRGFDTTRHARKPFTDAECATFNQRLGGLWTLPPDSRLNLEFQHHVLRSVEPDTDIVKHVTGIQTSLKYLYALGGSLEVTEFDDDDNQFTYEPFKSASASDVEEWFLAIRPKLLKVTPNGFPLDDWMHVDYRTGQKVTNEWKRTVRIRGLADAYRERLWDSTLRVDSTSDWAPRDRNILFDLHTSCSLKANERLRSNWQPSIFHMTWMEIGKRGAASGQQQIWERQDLFGSSWNTIGTVAASIEYFVPRDASSEYPVRKYWKILALLPKSLPPYYKVRESWSETCFWAVMILLITESMEVAAHSWARIANYMERLLIFGNAEQILIEDDKFSQSRKLFWIISKIDQMLPMISDAIAQWVWFSDANNLYPETEVIPLSMRDGGPPDQKALEPIMEQVRRLDDCRRELATLRERARSLRDGIFSLTSVKEARESRMLAENVKLLTYVTIFYLPLAFCTSMWAINNMFGTGTRGFTIITTAISGGTYAVVFGLLHPPSRRSINALLKKFLIPDFLREWDQDAPKELKKYSLEVSNEDFVGMDSADVTADTAHNAVDGEETPEAEGGSAIGRTDTVTGKGKEKETSTDEERPDVSEEALAQGKTSIINRLRGAKPPGQDSV